MDGEGDGGSFLTLSVDVNENEQTRPSKDGSGATRPADEAVGEGRVMLDRMPDRAPEGRRAVNGSEEPDGGQFNAETRPESPAPSCAGTRRMNRARPASALCNGDVDRGDLQDRGPPGDPEDASRPRSLRTNPAYAASLSCDATPLGPGDGDALLSSRNTFDVGRRQSAPDALSEGHPADPGPRKQGIAEFLSRSLFSWKPKEPKPAAPSAPGWKLFGKIPLRDNPPKDSRTIQQEFEAKAGPVTGPHLQSQPVRRKNLEFEPLSTTALILENRPAHLPAKSEEEAQRHKQEYDEMVAGAKRRELKEAQKKKQQLKERYRQEESIATAMVIWNNEVLPNWESMRNTRRVKDLWWQGLPPSVRGKVWSLAIGNELNITPELYEIFLSRAKEKWRSFSETSSENETEDCGASLADRESSLDLIKLDISRTFPSLYIFQKGGPYHDLLHSVLGAYTCYRPDVGYVQGMSFIAAVLILNLEEADAFIAFANLLNKPCQMAFFRVDHELMLKYFAAFEVFFDENLPRLFQHFQSNTLTPDLYLIDWIFTLYSKSLPLDVACRVWDVFCRDGEEALFRTGLGILRLYQDVLLQMDFIHIAQFLSRLPDNIPAHTLFNCIASTHMISSNRRWNQVFSALMKDGIKETDRNSSPALRS
ncbi:TBC1 domain family member 12 [Denticeps clupeoides]|uniref:Rab-GAP TBC domain-containing protein n=1 Tax=Denticeps clupeoides TaxID=299321 RepID=A0AAY4C2F2_9TELE|nr:TBC1 domain family member 12-like [Denticeps clupeoides]